MKCPKCGIALNPVPQSRSLNREQWDAVKAGDWFRESGGCDETACPVAGAGANPTKRYATDYGLAAYHDAEARSFGW